MSASPRQVNVNAQHEGSLSRLERLAVFVTEKIGTMGFFFIVLAWTVLWLGWNFLAPEKMRFDPYPAFVLWLFTSNVLQILLMPLIMVGQNLQSRHSETRAENDYQINQLAEQEVKTLLRNIQSIDSRTLAIVQHLHLVETAKDPP